LEGKKFLGLKKTKKYARAEYDGEGGGLITKTGLVGFKTGKFKNKFALGPNQKSKVYWTRNIETSPSDWRRFTNDEKSRHPTYKIWDYNCQDFCREFVKFILGEVPHDFPKTEKKKVLRNAGKIVKVVVRGGITVAAGLALSA